MKLNYREFLARKVPRAEAYGFEPPSDPHPSLFPHQVDIVRWMLTGGRRACFAAFGLGKTRMHIQVAQWIVEKTGKKYLIVAPLGVRQEFTKSDGPKMGVTIEYVRDDAEVAASTASILITNYERVRDGNLTLNPEVFAGAGLDEGSVLRSFGSVTYQTFLTLFKAIAYRFCFTATPSPNRHKELIHYAGFLGVMDTGDALTRFFKRDPKQANNLTLYPHMEQAFWMWLATWGVFIQRPSDLGYSDEGYDLPKLHVHWHRIPTDHTKAWKQFDNFGQAQLLQDQSTGLSQLAEVKRETIIRRLTFAMDLMQPGRPYQAPMPISEDERIIDAALHHVSEQAVLRRIIYGKEKWEKAFGQGGGTDPVHWFGHAKGISVGEVDGKERLIPVSAIMERAKQYELQPKKNWLIWHDLEAEREAIEKIVPNVRTAYGNQDLEEREETILAFGRGELPILATKPSIAGCGTNLQHYCSDAIFLGSSYKFHDFIQAIHRVFRFQQTREVHIHVIYTEAEQSVIDTLKRKWAEHDGLVSKMTALLQKYKLSLDPVQLVRAMGVEREERTGNGWRAVFNDSIEETEQWVENSIHQIVTSIPFGTQYEYSPNYCDFGHNPNNEGFFEQMEYLIPNLYRILKPGRLACIHVKDRIRFGNVTGRGVPTLDRFSDKTADAFERHGFYMMARITIDTDVVRENNQTYRLGWTENSKDSTKMGCGVPEYVLVMRKPQTDLSEGYADERVAKDKEIYMRSDWQIDAAGTWRSDGLSLPDIATLKHMPIKEVMRMWRQYCRTHRYDWRQHVDIAKAMEQDGALPGTFMLFPPVACHPDVWTDILRINVLNSKQEERRRENHVCPLQLDIVERLIGRYSNPGEIVLDPFAGIGTVPYQALKMGRQGWGIELCHDYWADFVHYCEVVTVKKTMEFNFTDEPQAQLEPSVA